MGRYKHTTSLVSAGQRTVQVLVRVPADLWFRFKDQCYTRKSHVSDDLIRMIRATVERVDAESAQDRENS